ncbi:MAG: homoserine dehydrogenase [Thaumarchaeota archaeon]|nr:homoserine dehydrogenase [Nitrososphaerota archaeon]MCS4539081.1 homoserine dehydrogenase [Nitrososphaerota archaeon]
MRLALVGFGVVGRSFAKLLQLKAGELASKSGLMPKVVCVIDNHSYSQDSNGLDLGKVLSKKNRSGSVGLPKKGLSSSEIISNTEADVLIETTQTNFKTGEPGFSHIKAAFQSKMSVVTANKGPLAVAFQSLTELARHNNVYFKFSGAVGGGTPILDFGRSCSKGDTIVRISGILNSTSNFILTHMERDALDFKSALLYAQREGYAEADPSLDVDGFDSAVKLVIMVNYLTPNKVAMRDVDISGIRGISLKDVERARKTGKAVRLVASADSKLKVSPELLDMTDPLCVSGAYNAVKFGCEFSGDKVIVGKGAGGMETASSILRDLIDIRGMLAARGSTSC